MAAKARELRLRELITSALDGDEVQLPSDVKRNVNERVLLAAKKDVASRSGHYKTLAGKLEFCDLRDLKQTIKNKLHWPKFEARFGTKEALAAKFGQLAELRNAIRHSRRVDEIMRMEGEAGIIWFERVLHDRSASATRPPDTA